MSRRYVGTKHHDCPSCDGISTVRVVFHEHYEAAVAAGMGGYYPGYSEVYAASGECQDCGLELTDEQLEREEW